jgi:VWFA-related protein
MSLHTSPRLSRSLKRPLAALLLPTLAFAVAFAAQPRAVAPATQQVTAPTPVTPQPSGLQQQGDANSTTFTLKVSTDIVLNNVVVRDKKTGAAITGLKASDFTITEDKKPQKIISFDYQNVDQAAALADQKTVVGRSVADILNGGFAAQPQQLHDHRLIVMFFDLSSMQEDDIDRAVEAAQNYVNKQMQPADLVALASLSTGLTLDQDFTADHTALLTALGKYNGTDASGQAAGGDGTTDGTSDDASSFTADDSEYNALNTDRELFAIRTIAKSVEKLDQRKSMLYFSGGVTRSGIENQASLRAATNEASKANMAIYSVDTRGLQALPPVGDATKGSLRGTAAYTGAAVQSQLNANFASQETLTNLSADTGGKAFLDSNDFAPAFQQVQHDTAAYYILGFRSTNMKRDGTFRHLIIKVDRPDVKIEYRPGYYAPSDFKHQKTEDREIALEEQMRSQLPATDVAVYLQALYFRRGDGGHDDTQFYVPMTLVIPGSQIPFVKNGDRDKATLDILGQVKDAQGIIVGNARDTVKLAVDAAQQVEHKNIQYTTGFALATGRYHVKFVVRENQTGAMGSFETDLNVPDFRKAPLKISSVVLASQRVPDKQKDSADDPLVRDGQQLVPNVAHVFRQGQHLYFLYEVYDPAKAKADAGEKKSAAKGAVRVLTSIEFLLGGAKVYETPVLSATSVNTPARDAVSFQFDVPLAQLKPGTYTCQINVIDDAGGTFVFPRTALRIEAPPAAAAQTAPDSAPH